MLMAAVIGTKEKDADRKDVGDTRSTDEGVKESKYTNCEAPKKNSTEDIQLEEARYKSSETLEAKEKVLLAEAKGSLEATKLATLAALGALKTAENFAQRLREDEALGPLMEAVVMAVGTVKELRNAAEKAFEEVLILKVRKIRPKDCVESAIRSANLTANKAGEAANRAGDVQDILGQYLKGIESTFPFSPRDIGLPDPEVLAAALGSDQDCLSVISEQAFAEMISTAIVDAAGSASARTAPPTPESPLNTPPFPSAFDRAIANTYRWVMESGTDRFSQYARQISNTATTGGDTPGCGVEFENADSWYTRVSARPSGSLPSARNSEIRNNLSTLTRDTQKSPDAIESGSRLTPAGERTNDAVDSSQSMPNIVGAILKPHGKEYGVTRALERPANKTSMDLHEFGAFHSELCEICAIASRTRNVFPTLSHSPNATASNENELNSKSTSETPTRRQSPTSESGDVANSQTAPSECMRGNEDELLEGGDTPNPMQNKEGLKEALGLDVSALVSTENSYVVCPLEKENDKGASMAQSENGGSRNSIREQNKSLKFASNEELKDCHNNMVGSVDAEPFEYSGASRAADCSVVKFNEFANEHDNIGVTIDDKDLKGSVISANDHTLTDSNGAGAAVEHDSVQSERCPCRNECVCTVGQMKNPLIVEICTIPRDVTNTDDALVSNGTSFSVFCGQADEQSVTTENTQERISPNSELLNYDQVDTSPSDVTCINEFQSGTIVDTGWEDDELNLDITNRCAIMKSRLHVRHLQENEDFSGSKEVLNNLGMENGEFINSSTLEGMPVIPAESSLAECDTSPNLERKESLMLERAFHLKDTESPTSERISIADVEVCQSNSGPKTTSSILQTCLDMTDTEDVMAQADVPRYAEREWKYDSDSDCWSTLNRNDTKGAASAINNSMLRETNSLELRPLFEPGLTVSERQSWYSGLWKLSDEKESLSLKTPQSHMSQVEVRIDLSSVERQPSAESSLPVGDDETEEAEEESSVRAKWERRYPETPEPVSLGIDNNLLVQEESSQIMRGDRKFSQDSPGLWELESVANSVTSTNNKRESTSAINKAVLLEESFDTRGSDKSSIISLVRVIVPECVVDIVPREEDLKPTSVNPDADKLRVVKARRSSYLKLRKKAALDAPDFSGVPVHGEPRRKKSVAEVVSRTAMKAAALTLEEVGTANGPCSVSEARLRKMSLMSAQATMASVSAMNSAAMDSWGGPTPDDTVKAQNATAAACAAAAAASGEASVAGLVTALKVKSLVALLNVSHERIEEKSTLLAKKLKDKMKFLRTISRKSSCSSCTSDDSTRILVRPAANSKTTWIIATLACFLVVILLTYALV